MNCYQAALSLRDNRYDVIPVGVMRNGVWRPKDPGLVKGWYTKQWTQPELAAALSEPRRGIGLRLSLETFIDIEADTKEADDFAASLFSQVSTVSWRGAGEDGHHPGVHRLFHLSDTQRKLFRHFGLNSKRELPGGLEVRTDGQSVVPPSGGRVWLVPPSHPIQILPESAFLELIDGLTEPNQVTHTGPTETDSPGSDFCQRGEWSDILTPHGWQVRSDGTVTRPGKSHGVSGTYKHCYSETRGDLLYVFSTSPEVAPLKPDITYSKFEAYAILNHDGYFSRAASQLKREGYGSGGISLDVESFFDDYSDPVEERIVERHKAYENPPVLDDKWFEQNSIGQYCLKLRDYTWVDSAAVYLQALEIFGALVGRNAWYRYGHNKRMLTDYLIVVGETGSGKGLAYDHAKTLFVSKEDGDIFSATNDAFQTINMGRFGSGEGLVTALMQREDADYQIGGVPVGEQYRGCVFAVDQEGVGSFKKMIAESSTLGDALLKSWDANSLSNSTKGGTLFVRNPLVSLIWHITPDVLEDLPAGLLDGGLINRLKFVNCRKPESLSREKAMPIEELGAFRSTIQETVEWVAEESREMQFSSEASELLWEIQQYQHSLNGVIATTHERYTAHVERMACRLALLRKSIRVAKTDVELAKAIHHYSFEWTERLIRAMRRNVERSKGLPQDRGEAIRRFLEDAAKDGVASWTEIRRQVFHGNIASEELNDAIADLQDGGIVELVKRKTKGRPATVVRLTQT